MKTSKKDFLGSGLIPGILFCSLIAGCTVPGMRLNVTAQGNDEPYVDFNSHDAPNVDVFPINQLTIRRLRDEAAAIPPRQK